MYPTETYRRNKVENILGDLGVKKVSFEFRSENRRRHLYFSGMLGVSSMQSVQRPQTHEGRRSW